MEPNASTIKPLFSWRSAICESELAPTTRHVALALSLYMSERGDSAFPGAVRLSIDTGLSERAVREHLGILRDQGWLELVTKGGLRGEKRTANVYRATVPDPQLAFDPCTSVTGDPPSPMILAASTPAPERADPCTTITPSLQELTKNSLGAHTRANGSRIPDPFVLTDEMEAWARTNAPGVNIERETQKFVLHFSAVSGNRGIMRNWTAAWKNWLLRAPDFERTR